MPHSPPLPTSRKCGYGAAETGIAAAEFLLQLHLLFFATQILKLPPLSAGLIIALAVVWDALSDPLMGLLLDRTRTRFGRFIPYLLSGSVLLAASLFLLFTLSPAGQETWPTLLALLGAAMLVNTSMTILAVPHLSLGAVLTNDPHERTELFGWRLVFGTLGLVAGLILPFLVARLTERNLDQTDERALILALTAAAIGVIAIGTSLVTTIAVRPFDRAPANPIRPLPRSILDDARLLLHDKAFIILFVAFIATSIARGINGATVFYYYEYTLLLTADAVVGFILLPFVLCIALSIPGWVLLSRRFGKKRPAFWGLASLGGMVSVAYPLFPPGQLAGPIVIACLGGIAAGSVVLFESLLGDISEKAETRSGRSQSGFYFGVWKLGTKLSRAAAIGLSGVLLGFVGFEAGSVEQTAAATRGLAWIFGPGVGLFFVAGAVIFLLTPADG